MKKIKLFINDDYKECDILYTFRSDITNKDYLICTDNTINDKNNLNVYSFIYYPNNKEKGIEKITDERDWKVIEDFLDLVGDFDDN